MSSDGKLILTEDKLSEVNHPKMYLDQVVYNLSKEYENPVQKKERPNQGRAALYMNIQ